MQKYQDSLNDVLENEGENQSMRKSIMENKKKETQKLPTIKVSEVNNKKHIKSFSHRNITKERKPS